MAGTLAAFGFGSTGETDRLLSVFDQMNPEFRETKLWRKRQIAAKPSFNIAVGLLIVANAIVVGVEADFGAPSNQLTFLVLDCLFALAFLIEMLLRLLQLGWDYFVDPWNMFDYLLVVLTCRDVAGSVGSYMGEADGSLRVAGALRAVRLLRVVRSIEGLSLFRGLWLVMQSLLASLRTMGWVALLGSVMIYCFAVALTTFVGEDDYVKEHWLQSSTYVGSVYRSMWTIMQVVTFDTWMSEVMRPLMEVSPISGMLILVVVIILTFGLLNVIVGVFVERTTAIAKQRREASGKLLAETEVQLIQSMSEDFCANDDSGDQELDFEEFKQFLSSESMTLKLKLIGMQVDEVEDLFELMDGDHSGLISWKEFATGLHKVKGNAKGQDMVQLITSAKRECLKASRYVKELRKLSAKADILQKRLNSMGGEVTVELQERRLASERCDAVWSRAAERQGIIATIDLDRSFRYPGLNGS